MVLVPLLTLPLRSLAFRSRSGWYSSAAIEQNMTARYIRTGRFCVCGMHRRPTRTHAPMARTLACLMWIYGSACPWWGPEVQQGQRQSDSAAAEIPRCIEGDEA